MQRLSDSELSIMQKIWESPVPTTASQLVAAFTGTRGWKSQTVSTFLSRLVEKGMLTSSKQGLQNFYQVAVDEAAYRAAETRSFLEQIHGGSVQSFLVSLYDSDGLSDDEIDELKDWLAKR